MTVVLALFALQACSAASRRAPETASPQAEAAATREAMEPDEAPPAAPRTVQPGPPGQGARTVDPGELAGAGGLPSSEPDVRFMQAMIPHHAQALEMTALVPARTDNEAIRRMALRMAISQRDEIALMERWLRERGRAVPAWGAPSGHGHHAGGAAAGHAASHAADLMPGMLTPKQMAGLEAARGAAFDRLFLESMIQHHEGAIVMVAELFSSRGGGQESEVFQFANHVDADQAMEIRRMRALLEALR